MAHKWYYGRGGKRFGPYSGAQLQGLAAAGDIGPEDMVWQEGIDKGSPASRVRYLFDAAAPPAAVGAAALAPRSSGTDLPEDADLVPLAEAQPPAPAQPAAAESSSKKRRVLSIKGGMIVSQDGFTLRYRKKCASCSHEDTSVASAAIRNGTTRVNYYCPKCKKSRPVEIQAVS
jgi:GYF domain 2